MLCKTKAASPTSQVHPLVRGLCTPRPMSPSQHLHYQTAQDNLDADGSKIAAPRHQRIAISETRTATTTRIPRHGENHEEHHQNDIQNIRRPFMTVKVRIKTALKLNHTRDIPNNDQETACTQPPQICIES
jgi:hypothetical protein